MKKFIAILSVFFAFTIASFAQTSPADLAKKDIASLSEAVTLSEQNKATFLELFKKKHEALSKPGLTDDKKKVIYKSIDAKLRGTLSAEQMAKIDSNPELLKQLTQN
ncbi:hypothetical protein [uncultured Flavobacterium sp.]|jgi:hypothetical protein|uniref:hypothetical protein n=1 Tax=uncultured Flavobacterium sp. TaxID=165435 RepID=UPI001201A7E6|nr:hypothetical protein [uncultured Flavobacterium sp.]THD30611.1 MAG: hypothetical protein DI588_15390 [Flavobacterium johnsoniae]